MRLALLLLAPALAAQIKVVELPDKSPLVSIRLVFLTGSAADPVDQAGVADLTATMLADGGTREMSYKQIVAALFPMAASVSVEVDKEMTTFSGQTHVDNLEVFYKLMRTMVLDPGWRADDLQRLRDRSVNYLRVSLRGNNDEELGKEALYSALYAGTAYGHENVGAVSALGKLTIDDLKRFYARHYSQANLMIGVAGGYPRDFPARVRKDFGALPKTGGDAPRAPKPRPIAHSRALLIEKDTRSVAYSIGYPIDVKRGDPDYPALLVATSYLGQHRESVGHLYDVMREVRGLNYGDYAYIEYFPRGMFQFQPSPNLARRSQIFQLWIRPVEPPTANFGLRLAMYELDKFVKEGLSEEQFERARMFLTKYVNHLTETRRAELGYRIDSAFYGIGDYNGYVKQALAKLTREQVNQAIRRHLRADRVQIVAVTRNAEDLKRQLLAGESAPMPYNSPKPAAVTEEDRIVQKWNLGLRPQDIEVIPVGKIFE